MGDIKGEERRPDSRAGEMTHTRTMHEKKKS